MTACRPGSRACHYEKKLITPVTFPGRASASTWQQGFSGPRKPSGNDRKNADEQNRQGKYPAALPVPDCGDGAILRAVTAHGALLLFSADFVLGVLLRTQALDYDC